MTKISFDVSDSINVGLRGGRALEVKPGTMDPKGLAYLFEYGVKQALRDVYSGEKDAAKCEALATERYTALCRGELPRGGGGRRPAYGPVWAEVRKAATIIMRGRGPIDWKAVGAAMDAANGDLTKIRKAIVKGVGLPIAVAVKKGRKATFADADAVVSRLFAEAEAKVARDDEMIDALVEMIDPDAEAIDPDTE